MEEHMKVRLEKLQKLEELGVEIYPYDFDKSNRARDLISDYANFSKEELEPKEVKASIAGRIIAMRKMGKSSFIHIFDGEEKVQIYIKKDKVSENDFLTYKLLDIGDIIGVSGQLFITHSGELTINVEKLTFLTKSFHPLPEKFHGLVDIEQRYRKRYLDLIMNENARKNFELRSLMIQEIRMFFYEKGYREVETPMMQSKPGGASARPFTTHHNALDIELYLRIAPELYLKRLMVGGMEKIFEINRNFRNEGLSMMHNPEFTMIEFYQLYKDFNYYMALTEELFAILSDKFLKEKNGIINYNDKEISLKGPFKRVKFMDLIVSNSSITLEELWDETKLREFINKNHSEEEKIPTYGKMLEFMFDTYGEIHLIEPTFVTYYPKEISPLSKVSRIDNRETERFELFIAGMEIANGFSELNDPIDQRGRFESQMKDRELGDDEAQPIDEDFLNALEHGMAPAAGEGLGIDRLVMLFAEATSIKEVILFPLLRPQEIRES